MILATKRWWRFRSITSLWATFLKNKYCIRTHFTTKKWASGNSHQWKMMTQGRSQAEEHMIWQINSRSSGFWWDNWSGKGHLAMFYPDRRKSINTLVNHFLLDDTWNIHKLRDTLSEHMVQHIITIGIGNKNKRW